MSQRYFCLAEYPLSQNLKLTLKLTLNLAFFRVGLVFLVSFKFCLSAVLRWVKISLAHFSGVRSQAKLKCVAYNEELGHNTSQQRIS